MKLFENGLHNIFIVIAIFMLHISYKNTSEMFLSEYNGKIVSQELVCEQPLNNRCVHAYSLINNEGQQSTSSQFISGVPNVETVVGNHITKTKFSFSYKVNGVEKYWNYWFLELKLFISGIILLMLWLSPYVRKIMRRPSDANEKKSRKNPFSR
jgi:hypothetical protein